MMSSHVKYTQTKNDVTSNFNPYKLATTKEWGLYFILSDNDNYDFDIKIGRCRLWVL